MEMQAIQRGIKGTISVGRKYIVFRVGDTTNKVGEISREPDGKYLVYGGLWIATHEIRKEAVLLALRKAGFKIL